MKRLGKQRVETLQILNALSDPSYGWQNHPAVIMWQGYENSLIRYGEAICEAWIARGYKDTCLGKIRAKKENFDGPDERPWWLGNIQLHASHRGMLHSKNPKFYAMFQADFGPELEYWWPSQHQVTSM
jgi:hypothetical protein